MRWNRLFEDLEHQLASEWEAERAALDSEAERLRVSRLALRDRLVSLVGAAVIGLETSDGEIVRGAVVFVGADVVAIQPESAPHELVLAPLPGVHMLVAGAEALLASVRSPRQPRSPLSDRITLGFVLRDAARRRMPVRISRTRGAELTGTLDRVGADHADIALHDAGAPRRASAVRGHRSVAFAAIASVRVAAEVSLPG